MANHRFFMNLQSKAAVPFLAANIKIQEPFIIKRRNIDMAPTG